jgi:hypothetical protein
MSERDGHKTKFRMKTKFILIRFGKITLFMFTFTRNSMSIYLLVIAWKTTGIWIGVKN